MHARKLSVRLVALTLVVGAVVGIPSMAAAAVSYRDIATSGPVEHLYVGSDLSCQVATTVDGEILEFYPPTTVPGDCGTFLAVGGALYTPDFANHDVSATSFTNATPFTPVSQSDVTGSGTEADPYRVITVADAGPGLRLTETNTYVTGEAAFRTEVAIENTTGGDVEAILYRAGDCYLGASDSGYGSFDAATGSVGCREDEGGAPGPRLAEFVPLSPDSSYFEGGYEEVWEQIDTRLPLPNTCDCDLAQDNGAGLSWNVSIPDGGSVTRSHLVRYGSSGFNQPPVPILSALAVDWTGPFSVAFAGGGSFDPDGQVVGYEWDFGDGGTSTEPSPTHGYLGAGTFTVALTVTDDGGESATTFEDLTIAGDPVVDFAPEVRLHPEEDHFPMEPDAFISESDLEWAHDNACDNDYVVDQVAASDLGSGGYEHRQARSPLKGCRHNGPRYDSAQLTRPFDGNPARENIAGEEGFYLDFDESTEPGAFSPVPAWTQITTVDTSDVVTYWLFYGRSVPRKDGMGLDFIAHEGDWEHVNVELDRTTRVPVQIGYFAHTEGANRHPYPDVERTGLVRPVAYVAWTAHGTYPDTGSTEVCNELGCVDDERADGGPVWETWDDLREVLLQPWHGFGGAWGTKGETGGTTGPLGPSSYKSPL